MPRLKAGMALRDDSTNRTALICRPFLCPFGRVSFCLGNATDESGSEPLSSHGDRSRVVVVVVVLDGGDCGGGGVR